MVNEVLQENVRRLAENNRPFNPITGEGSIGERVKLCIEGYPIPEMYVPKDMLKEPIIKHVKKKGITGLLKEAGVLPTDKDIEALVSEITKIRCKYDFPFWAATFVYIKRKGGGDDVLFRLTRPQRKFANALEEKRRNNQPIRFVVLKARQWGGSTTSQLFMAWLQLVHCVGLNSLIIAHQVSGSDEIKDMFDRMIKAYPLYMLHELGEEYRLNESKLVGVGRSGNIQRVPQRNCKIKLGTAERPNSCRGGDYNLVHLSEVGLWKETDGHKPEDIIRSSCGGMWYVPYTMIVYESTANGQGDLFYKEYKAAKEGTSQFGPLFISWFDIDDYSLPFSSDEEREQFAKWLCDNKELDHVDSDREEPGQYLWYLWTIGATLEGIHWYVVERKKFSSHAAMAREYPSDDVEAFMASGERVFSAYDIAELEEMYCKAPKWKGDISSLNPKSIDGLTFSPNKNGLLCIWEKPDIDESIKVCNRYLVVVDIGGRSNKADWSVIAVFDRLDMIDGGKPRVVAQWRGHIDMDLLAWKSAQIAKYYDNALLVIESNTLETHDRERYVDGNQSHYILNQISNVYDNLYARKQSEEEIIERAPLKYGFHTNQSTKPMIISTLIEAVRTKAYVERDATCFKELSEYERRKNGSFSAIVGEHDDVLMTRAIGLHICFNEMPMPRIIDKVRKNVQRKIISEATF